MKKVYSKGDIVLVDMGPNTQNTEKSGIRPCVVISNDIMNENSMNMVIAPLTNAEHKKINGTDRYYLLPTNVMIERDGINNLDAKSIVQLEDIRSISKKRVVKYIGRFRNSDLDNLNSKLPKIFFI